MRRKTPVRILVVDNNPSFLKAASRFIDAHEDLIVAGTAGNGEAAVAAVVGGSFDCVVLDAALPVMDGFEATRWIKAQPGAPLVFVLSVHDRPALQLEAWAAGADAFLTKIEFPGQFVPLLRSLRSALPSKLREETSR